MKFLVILSVIAFICAVSAVPTKEELQTRAQNLEKRLETEIQKMKTRHPVVARILETQLLELKVVSAELEHARLPPIVVTIGARLAIVELIIEAELARIEGRTGAPTQIPTGNPVTSGLETQPQPPSTKSF